jgi:hypothetical protein
MEFTNEFCRNAVKGKSGESGNGSRGGSDEGTEESGVSGTKFVPSS